MELSEVLEKTGLNEKEARVYLALLELGTASVETIAVKAGTKRPTTYLILDELQRKGLVSLVPQAKKTLFTAETPEHLLSDLNRKQDLVRNFLPNLLALHNARKEKPQVQLFQGIEGVKLIYQKIYEAGGVWFFGTTQEIAKLDPAWNTAFLKRMRENDIPVRDLLKKSKEDLEYARNVERGKTYEIRFLPDGLDFPNDNAIFGDCVVFFSFHPQVFAVLIQSKDISKSLKTLHELAWRASVPYEKVISKQTEAL